jgi:membrane protein DedA with SNARE-associated domain
MVTYIIDILVKFVVATIGMMGYTGVFVLMFLESCGIPIPSEAIMPFSGFLVAEGQMNFWLLSFIGAFGNLMGSLLAYWIGLKGGRPFIEKYGKYCLISKHDLDIADRWFTKHGQLTVFGGRLLPAVRTYISFPAGIAKMDIKKFSFYTFAGAFPWSALFAWFGVKLGNNWELVRQKLHDFDMAIVGLIVLCVVLYVWRHIKHTRAS